MTQTNSHWFASFRDYWIGITLMNIFQGIIIYFNSEANYYPVVDLLVTIILGLAVNAFIALLIFMIVGLYKRHFTTERFVKTFATWSFIYLLVIVTDSFIL